tara:strand:+ start:246 stop:524 length:279 start_codon:yes stop_codon:yes gene_type:complete
MIENRIKKLITENLDTIFFQLDDLTEKHKTHDLYTSGGHYKVIIVSNTFHNMTLLERHKLIYGILKDMIKKEIHALSINAFTKKEFDISNKN